MSLKSPINLLFAAICVFYITTDSVGQSVDLDYKSRFRNVYAATIYFSDSNGSEAVSPEEFYEQDYVYFTISVNQRSQRDHFRESDIEDELTRITLLQGDKEVSMTSRLVALDISDGQFTKVLMTYPKEDLMLYEPIAFRSPYGKSESISLDEVYFENYAEYNSLYLNASDLIEENKYLKAFDMLLPIAKDTENLDEIRQFSFYQDATESLIEQAVTNYTNSLVTDYESHMEIFLHSMGLPLLRKKEAIIDSLALAYEMFTPYFEAGFPQSNALDNLISETLEDLKFTLSENREKYRSHKIAFFENGSFSDFQFRLYIDALAKLLIHTNEYRIIDQLRPLDISKLDYFEDVKDYLTRTQWLDDFEIMVTLLNQDIQKHQAIFKRPVMNNLSDLSVQEQPYFEVFSAFNAKSSERGAFNYHINNALKKISDPDMMEYLERWALSHRFTSQNINPNILDDLNSGLDIIAENNWRLAAEDFEVLTMQASNMAPPWYYAAIIDMELQDEYSALAKIEHALDRYPGYISPRLQLFEWLYEKEMYEDLLDEVSMVLSESDVYLYHLWKARALFLLERYSEAADRITEYAHELNPYDLESWFLLGDAYYGLGDIDNARWSYRRTQVIDPFTSSERYNNKMQTLFNE